MLAELAAHRFLVGLIDGHRAGHAKGSGKVFAVSVTDNAAAIPQPQLYCPVWSSGPGTATVDKNCLGATFHTQKTVKITQEVRLPF